MQFLRGSARMGALVGALVVGTASVDFADAQEIGDSFAWCELLTYDAPGAVAFYGELFGWQSERTADGKFRLTHGGATIGGVTQIQRRTPGIDESTWLVGLLVDDTPAAVAAAKQARGTVLRDVTEARDGVRWAVLEDQQGAQVLLMSGGERIATDAAPGRFVWAELWTTDEQAAATFYGEVMGWTLARVDHPNGEYPVFQRDGRGHAGLVTIAGEQVTPGWAAYVGVADLDATLQRARELGAQVLLEPDPAVHAGRVAVLADPTGVGFLVVELRENDR